MRFFCHKVQFKIVQFDTVDKLLFSFRSLKKTFKFPFAKLLLSLAAEFKFSDAVVLFSCHTLWLTLISLTVKKTAGVKAYLQFSPIFPKNKNKKKSLSLVSHIDHTVHRDIMHSTMHCIQNFSNASTVTVHPPGEHAERFQK